MRPGRVVLGAMTATILTLLPADGASSQTAADCTGAGACLPDGLLNYSLTSYGTGCTFSATVDWGDGTSESFSYASPNSVNAQHQYTQPGIYTVSLTGTASGENCTYTPSVETYEVPRAGSAATTPTSVLTGRVVEEVEVPAPSTTAAVAQAADGEDDEGGLPGWFFNLLIGLAGAGLLTAAGWAFFKNQANKSQRDAMDRTMKTRSAAKSATGAIKDPIGQATKEVTKAAKRGVQDAYGVSPNPGASLIEQGMSAVPESTASARELIDRTMQRDLAQVRQALIRVDSNALMMSDEQVRATVSGLDEQELRNVAAQIDPAWTQQNVVQRGGKAGKEASGFVFNPFRRWR
jgi:PKD repeat protein